MELVSDGLKRAIEIIESSDQKILRITWLTLKVSSMSLLFSALLGLPFGMLLGLFRFK